MKEFLIKQIKFETWAYGVLIEAIEKVENLDERTLFLLSHLSSSYDMWLSRLTGKEITSTLFQQRSLSECKEILNSVLPQYIGFIENTSEESLQSVFPFTFPLDGSKRKIMIQDAIAHLVMHSVYHRAQIIVTLKGKIEPLPLTTYIMYAMENNEE